jgi:pimeloyl-ACP methyl ester carboxylesterase
VERTDCELLHARPAAHGYARGRPTSILWQDQDAIFPYHWSDQLDAFFQDYTLERLSGIGHFTPLEATDRFAEAIKQRLAS